MFDYALIYFALVYRRTIYFIFLSFRYLAICYTLQFKISSRVCRIIILGIWIFSLVIMIPWVIYFKQIEYTTSLQLLHVCLGDWPSRQVERAYILGAVFLSCYTIPLILIIVCYVLIGYRVWNRDAPGISNSSGVIYKSKVKVVKMLAVVVMLFALSWLPIYIIRLRQMYIEFENDEGTEELMMYEIFVPIAQWLGSSNSGANPIIYCFFSKRFRRGFKNMMSCRTQKQSDLQRQVSRYSSTKYMTVDYANGHVTLSFKKEVQEDDDSSSTRTYV